MHADRIKAISDDLYFHLFSVLDAESDLDGLEAGRIATTVQQAFESAVDTGTAADFARQSISAMIARIQDAIQLAHREGFDVLNDESLPDFNKIDESICLSSWVLGLCVHEFDQRIFLAALDAYKVEIEVASDCLAHVD